MSDVNSGLQSAIVDDDYRTTYEVFVYSFADSDSDGIGDLKGLTDRLDYISDLGFNQIWLMPVCPSPTYHKYDVTDYMNIDPQYGT
ncbi:MAG: alpha-amylase, partial [Solobacterium sp.]|nr:alpha-amylase [Solobacterium sp.]